MPEGTSVATRDKKPLTQRFAERYHVEPGKLLNTLMATAFKQRDGTAPSMEQMTALLIVADQHQLNPFTREIYAFEDQSGGIVPVVGVDGWARIINRHPQFDGMAFEQDAESCTCIIYRKDRTHPVSVTEWLAECERNTKPWKSHPRRMLRHKAMIQCARLAFSFSGIYDPDEAEAIGEHRAADATTEPEQESPSASNRAERPTPDAERFEALLADWRPLIESGETTSANAIAMLGSRYTLTDEQAAELRACEAIVDAEFTTAEDGGDTEDDDGQEDADADQHTTEGGTDEDS